MPVQPAIKVFGAVVALAIASLPMAPARAQVAAEASVRAALEAAARGDVDAARKAGLDDHLLAGWIEYAALVKGIDDLAVARATDFLSRHRGQPVAAAVREQWRAELADRGDRRAILAAGTPGIEGTSLCTPATRPVRPMRRGAARPRRCGGARASPCPRPAIRCSLHLRRAGD